MAEPRSLHEEHAGLGVPSLIVGTLVLLAFGIALPVVETEKLGVYSQSYSVVGGVLDLGRSGHLGLALLILFFSVVFPVYKLVALLLLWFHGTGEERRVRDLGRLEALGKWSMLDVFVVVILIGTLNLGLPSGATARPGVLVFGAAILASMIATLLTVRVAGHERAAAAAMPGPAWRPWAALVAFGLLSGGLVLPLMEAGKWVFWDREYSILTGALELLDGDEVLLGLAVLAFVVLAPLIVLAGTAVRGLRGLFGRTAPVGGGWLRQVERWAMADVFALAFLVVVVKLAGLIVIRPRTGLWLFAAGVLLSTALAWSSRRRPT